MLISGDKIKMVKAVPGFDKVGDIFTVDGISESGDSMRIKSSYGIGIMSYDEFEKYFEKYVEKELVWTDWDGVFYVLPETNMDYEFKTNGKEIHMRDSVKDITVKTSCLDEDIFNLELGLELCIKKLEVAKIHREMKESLNKLHVARRGLLKQLKEM